MDQATLAANKDIARKFFQAFEQGDIAATMALFAPGASYWMPTVRKEFGMQEFESGLRWIQSRLRSGIRFKLGDIVAEGSKVCIMAESFAETLEGRPFNNLYHNLLSNRERQNRLRERVQRHRPCIQHTACSNLVCPDSETNWYNGFIHDDSCVPAS